MENSLPNNLTPIELAVKKGLILKQGAGFADNLLDKILARIEHEKQIQALKPRLWASAISLGLSVGIIVFGFIFAANAFNQTGLSKYLTLAFTDFGSVISNWQDFSYSILENLPLSGLLVLLGAFFASAWCIDFGARQFLNFRKLRHS